MLKSSQFRPPTPNQGNFDAHTKTKWYAARIPKPSQPRPPTQNQVNRSH